MEDSEMTDEINKFVTAHDAQAGEVVKLVTARSDAEIAEDLKRRLVEAMVPVLAIFDEAKQHKLVIQWDGIGPMPPLFNYGIMGVRVVKFF
jgi:hypothetical protein